MTNLRRPARIVTTIFSGLLLATVVAAAAALIVIPKLTGSMPLTVLTGSMAPTYEAGGVVVVRPTPFDEIKVGDPVTYQMRSGDPEVVTHRVISMAFAADGSRRLITQGDANSAADSEPVREIQVRGTVWYSVPYVGHLATAISPEARATAVKVVAVALFGYAGFQVLGGRLGRRRSAQKAVTT